VNLSFGDAPNQRHLRSPQRALGRICSELGYLEINDVLDQNMHPYLDRLLSGLNEVGIEISKTYFNTQVMVPASHPSQQQSQQQ